MVAWLRRLSRLWFGIGAFVAFIFILFLWLWFVRKGYIEIGDALNLTVLTVLVGVTLYYAWHTLKIAEATRQANVFNALSRVHEVFSNKTSYSMRELLYTGFAQHLARATKEVLGDKYVKENKEGPYEVNIDAVLASLGENENKLKEFNVQLNTYMVGVKLGSKSEVRGETFGTREMVEHLLLDFDAVAIPVSLVIEAAINAAEAYEPIFKQTAPLILPFVAIQLKLRNEPDYKKHYLYLLEKLNIETKTVEKIKKEAKKLKERRERRSEEDGLSG